MSTVLEEGICRDSHYSIRYFSAGCQSWTDREKAFTLADMSMAYLFFILFGLLIVSWGIGAWYIAALQKKIAKLYGGVELAGDDMHAEVVRRLGRIETQLEELEPRLARTEAIADMSVQKIGFVRFNPFHDTGGDNSFILTLLDAENTGVMVSSLFAREGVRIYGKAIERGRSRHQLSEEEKKVLEETMQK